MAAAFRKVVEFFFGVPWPEMDPKAVRSDFLIVQPSGFHGMARTFDLAGEYDLYNISGTPPQADANALFADFVVIGEDLRVAMEDCDVADESVDPPALPSPTELTPAPPQRASAETE